VVVFTSGSTARNFVRLLGPDDGLRLLRSATVAAIGPTTAGVLRALGKEPEIVPRESTTKALAAAVEDFFSR
jgi:uroporphyrinogen III methyltransferase/synthase